MCIETKKALFQRRHSNDQQALTRSSASLYQGDANQGHDKMSCHLSGWLSTRIRDKCWENVEEREASCTAGGKAHGSPTMETSMEGSQHSEDEKCHMTSNPTCECTSEGNEDRGPTPSALPRLLQNYSQEARCGNNLSVHG